MLLFVIITETHHKFVTSFFLRLSDKWTVVYLFSTSLELPFFLLTIFLTIDFSLVFTLYLLIFIIQFNKSWKAVKYKKRCRRYRYL